jgi:predicted molibdopterin-dependent oxidoreductase YjgC
MLKTLPLKETRSVTVYLDGAAIEVPAGLSVAAALLLRDEAPYRRSALSSAARAPYCMMGVCFDCLVEIDGQANCQGCLVEVREGMRVRRQMGARVLTS